MIELVIQWKDFLNPEFYIQHGGLWLFLFIIFAETGLFAGFFLPGDSLLFVAGIYSNELAVELVIGLAQPADHTYLKRKTVFYSKRNICIRQRNFMISMEEGPLYSQGSFPLLEPLLQ